MVKNVLVFFCVCLPTYYSKSADDQESNTFTPLETEHRFKYLYWERNDLYFFCPSDNKLGAIISMSIQNYGQKIAKEDNQAKYLMA